MKRDRRNEFAIYMISFFSMVSYAIPPTLALIAKDYAWASSTQIQLIVTLPSLAMLPTAILAPPLQKKFSLKSLFLINIFATLILGLIPVMIQDFYLILITRAVSGISLGFIQILLTFTITTRFPISDQGRIMGGRSIFSGLGAILIALLGGLLADINWRWAFLLFLVMIPALLITWISLQKMAPISDKRVMSHDHNGKRKRIDAVTVFICVSCLIHVIFLQSFTTNVSLLVDAEQFGTATDAGIAISVFHSSGLVFGLILAGMRRWLKDKSLFVGFLSSAVGILLVGLALNKYMVFAGGFFAGFGLSAYLGIGPLDITATIPKERAAIGVSMLAVTLFLGTFLTPYVVNPMADFIVKDSIRMRFVVAGVFLFVQTALYEIIRRRRYADCYQKKRSFRKITS